jgi:S1-C subfamily serine protease
MGLPAVLLVALAVAQPDESGKATEMERVLRAAPREPVLAELRLAQQRAAAATWLVTVSVRLEGEFEKIDAGELVGTDVVTTVEYWGSAAAVSSGGDLLTNRHVVDPRYLVAIACLDKRTAYAEARVTSARVDYAFLDFAGEGVPGRATVIPPDARDVCDDPMSALWENVNGYPARIAALDERSDLALVRLAVAGIPFIPPDAASPVYGDPVAALGYDGGNQRLVRLPGKFLTPCAEATDTVEKGDKDVVFLPQPMPMAESTVPVRPGMSGGPMVTAAMVFAGINAMSDAECEEGKACPTEAQSYSIPGAYAVAWYRWTIGTASSPPALCTPGPYAIPMFDPFGSVRHR